MPDSSIIYLKILNELNVVVQDVDDFEFYAGEDRAIQCQLWHEANDGAYILEDPATVTFKFKTKSGFDISKPGVVDAVNRSIVTASLNAADTAQMINGDIKVEFIETGATRIAKQGDLSRGAVLLR